MTTLEKIRALVDAIAAMPPGDADESTRNLIEIAQIMRGLGFDPVTALLPQSEAEADQQVDALITLLLQVRGDDLPAYDFERHVREATAAGDA
ncbi:MAG TPA: hypothetical protein VGJ25_09160 [Gaiellaceae bacterium]|jgi:hypothetical protein